jgi:hypothetical protein
MAPQSRAVRLAGSTIDCRCHACAFFDSREDEYQVLLPFMKEGIEAGDKAFDLTRLWANMEWALEDLPGVHDIVAYEARLNYVLPKYDTVTVCTYDVTKFSASLLMDVLPTHPFAIVGGVLQQNSFYVPPDQFLEELHSARSH